MIIISDAVIALIDDYINYLIDEGITSKTRALEKKNLMIQAIHNNLGGMVTHRLSPYKELGNDERCLLYVYKDMKSKGQWGFAYKRFDDNDAIVYYMRNLKLVRENKI
ncbi:MAG: hypothetical protein FWF53_10035 [Candidatus Azobacteroides sp.]|nr:hypothetical protein [Candidatus Azobacteroides sp.]